MKYHISVLWLPSLLQTQSEPLLDTALPSVGQHVPQQFINNLQYINHFQLYKSVRPPGRSPRASVRQNGTRSLPHCLVFLHLTSVKRLKPTFSNNCSGVKVQYLDQRFSGVEVKVLEIGNIIEKKKRKKL